MRAFSDLLVTFNCAPPVISRSGRDWRPADGSALPAAMWMDDPGPTGREAMAPRLQRTSSPSWDVWLLGELFGYRDAAPDAAFRLWCQDLERACENPETLNGHFLMMAVDRRDGSWHAWTDRLGTVHLYHGRHGGRTAVGTFHPAVMQAASRRTLDWIGMAGFFAFGFFPEDRTHVDDVTVVRPSTHIVWDREGTKTSESRYWTWSWQPDSRRSYSDTVDAFGDTLSRILRDQTASGRMVLPMSSGLDSRTVAAVVSAAGPPERIAAYSYGYADDSPETGIAGQVAAARGMGFDRFTIQPYLFDRLDAVLASVEGFGDVTLTRQAAVSEEIAARGDYLIAAHWGDVWMNDSGVPTARVPEGELVGHCLKMVERPGRQWLLDRLAARHLPEPVPQVLGESVAREVGRLRDLGDADIQAKAFKTDQWSFRWTIPGVRMFQAAAFPRLPFYDNRMVDLCLTIPARYVAGRRLQIDYLKRHHPDLAGITWDVSHSSLFLARYRQSLMLPRRALAKAGRWWSGKTPVSRNWEVQFLTAGMRPRLEDAVLARGLRLDEFVSRAERRELLARFYERPGGADGYTVAQLLTFSAWLERYA